MPIDGRAWISGASGIKVMRQFLGSSDKKVLRGGSWSTNPNNCRSARRFDAPQDFRYKMKLKFLK